MIRRLFYMLLGAGITLWVIRKLQSLTPRSLAHRAAGRAAHLARTAQGSARSFALDAQDAMRERENELRTMLDVGDHVISAPHNVTDSEKDGR